MTPEQILARLAEAKANIASDLVASPEADLHAIGRSRGMYAGLAQAEDIIVAMLEDAHKRDI